jgi:hypothetical protein
VVVAILVNWHALHVIHYQIGQTFLSTATIEQLDDIRVIELGQSLAFVAKAAQQFFSAQLGQENFDGHLLLILFIRTGCQIDGSHATPTNSPNDFVRSDAAANHQIFKTGNPDRGGRFTFGSGQK